MQHKDMHMNNAAHTNTQPLFIKIMAFNELFMFFAGVTLLLFLIGLFFWDRYQKKHTILRNYPVIGHFRYIFEYLGDYFRQYFFSNDREELPFNRVERTWIYRAAKHKNTILGFGSTRPLNKVGGVYFVSAPFPPLSPSERNRQHSAA